MTQSRAKSFGVLKQLNDTLGDVTLQEVIYNRVIRIIEYNWAPRLNEAKRLRIITHNLGKVMAAIDMN